MNGQHAAVRRPGGTPGSSGRDGGGEPAATSWSFAPEPYTSADARMLWREYYTEVSDRWFQREHGRDTDPAELERGIAADTGDGLGPPSGRLLVARYDGEPAGMAGVRLMRPRIAELKRVYVRPVYRGRGGATLLVGAAEEVARDLGAPRIVLDTRADLVEARALYARLGYEEIPAYNDNGYAEHWFGKDL